MIKIDLEAARASFRSALTEDEVWTEASGHRILVVKASAAMALTAAKEPS